MALVYLGDAYRLGMAVSTNFAEAERWYTQAADKGSLMALYLLGRVHMRRKEYNKAREEFGAAMVRGFPPAAHILGRMYWAGTGGEKNLQLAEAALRRAVSLRSVTARLLLGRVLIEKRSGVLETLLGMWFIVRGAIELLPLTWGTRKVSERLL